MCGIAGVVEERESDASRLSRPRVESMVAAIDHRGPDANGVRVLDGAEGRRATLGAVRLRIIHVDPASDQPMSDADEAVWTVFNGEIYNFRELRAELTAAGHRFRTDSDTECLVHLYKHYDGDAIAVARRLRGMFAFAIWDVARGRLIAGRDRVGIKPFFWARTSTGFAFCSEQRALVRAGYVSGALQLDALGGYLAKGVVSNEQSIFEDVHRLAPGHVMTWEGGEPSIAPYWAPNFVGSPTSSGDAEASLREVLADSVDRHLVAERSVGVFLSSGTDSRAIATVAARTGSQKSLTVRFPEHASLDEGPVAAETARRLGFEHIEVPVTGEDALSAVPSFLDSLDSPSADALNMWLVCRAAKDAGLTVVLSGVGGDELFAGYRSFRQVPRLRSALPYIARVPGPARNAAATVLRRNARTRPLARAVTSGVTGSAGAYHLTRRLFEDRELSSIGLSSPRLFQLESDPGGIDAVTLLELGSYLRDQLLPDADTTSMSHSLELRVPLLDDRVLEFALGLPSDVRSQGKSLMARAAGLPSIEAKRTFTLPLAFWMTTSLRPLVRDAVMDESLPLGDVLPIGFRSRIWQEFEAGRAHWTKVWAVAVLRMWASSVAANSAANRFGS